MFIMEYFFSDVSKSRLMTHMKSKYLKYYIVGKRFRVKRHITQTYQWFNVCRNLNKAHGSIFVSNM